eukprot:CAMPEP_0177778202 /NCGR_PEP_ID=MMETSP0491_2-20121128/15821_1 /TAXON_ID=63592 /ORGANISM="Tetraselmis chuii, Strain PLY429" /LENGTH=969 /DNA_ID=CAMNT_0019297445 /DNA_START=242 /DNA_END=3147 /DNA_ORIENTATION=-
MVATASFWHSLVLLLLILSPWPVFSQDNACASDLELLQGFEGAEVMEWNGLVTTSDWANAGVTCVGGQVTRLDFATKTVRATLPAVWSNLTALEVIEGEGNGFIGSLPPSWSVLTSMVTFMTAEQQLTGPLPPQYSTWTDLRSFQVYGSRLQGSLPLEYSSWSRLRGLLLQDNRLTGGLPEEYSIMKELEELEVDNNPLGGTLPPEYSVMSRMRELYLEMAGLEGTLPPEYSTWEDLALVQLSANWITGLIPPSYSRLHQLERFDLTENLMTGTIPAEWSTMTTIQILRLSNTLLTGTLPPEWSTMTALVDLDFEGSDFLTGTIPQEWGETYTNLQDIYLPDSLVQYGCVPDSMRDSAQRLLPDDIIIPDGCTYGEEAAPIPLPSFDPAALGVAVLSVEVAVVVDLPVSAEVEGLRHLQMISAEQWEGLNRASQKVVTLFVDDVARLAGNVSASSPLVELHDVSRDGSLVNVRGAVYFEEGEDTAVAAFRSSLAPDAFLRLSSAGYAVRDVSTAVPEILSEGVDGEGGVPVSVIAGVAIALLCVAGAITMGAVYFIRRQKKNVPPSASADASHTHTLKNIKAPLWGVSTGSSASHCAETSQMLCLGSDSAEEMSGMRPLVSPFQLLWPGSYTGPGMDAPVRQVLSASSHGSEEDFTALVACVVAAQLQLDRHFLLLAVMTLNGSGGSAGRQHRPTLAPSHHPAKEAGNHRKQAYRLLVPLEARNADFVSSGVDFNVDFMRELHGRLGEQLGAGAFGQVYKADWRGLEVAVKLFRQQSGSPAGAPPVLPTNDQFSIQLKPKRGKSASGTAQQKQHAAAQFVTFKAELRMMAELSKGSERVVRMYGACLKPPNVCILYEYVSGGYACLKPPNVCILYEYVSGGSLHDRIYADPPLTYLEVLCLARDIAEGLAFMHPQLVHRDLKPQNVLLDGAGRAKLCDLGLGRKKDPLQSYLLTEAGGTPFYMAPEVFS